MLVAALVKCELDIPADPERLADGDWLVKWDMDPDCMLLLPPTANAVLLTLDPKATELLA